MRIDCFKIYGAAGHRQRESFSKSSAIKKPDGNFLFCLNSDLTGTNEYSVLIMTHEKSVSDTVVYDDLEGQLSDGIFENSRTGLVMRIPISVFFNCNALYEFIERGL